jgi:hypothetical protein
MLTAGTLATFAVDRMASRERQPSDVKPALQLTLRAQEKINFPRYLSSVETRSTEATLSGGLSSKSLPKRSALRTQMPMHVILVAFGLFLATYRALDVPEKFCARSTDFAFALSAILECCCAGEADVQLLVLTPVAWARFRPVRRIEIARS